MGPKATAPAARKRVRKRKRRNVSSSSSESSSSSDSETSSKHLPEESTEGQRNAKVASSSSSSSSSEESDTDSSLSDGPERKAARASAPARPSRPSRSPSPVQYHIPPFLPPAGTTPTDVQLEQEQAMKDKFRQFWMSSVADAFKDDLEQIRKEPNLTTSRLAMLIDSLGSGAEVFSSTSGNGSDVNEIELMLGQTQ